ncbi:MAG: hypothetical protein ACRDRW_19175 [Pseudonocardiaceae bacterium]
MTSRVRAGDVFADLAVEHAALDAVLAAVDEDASSPAPPTQPR